MKITVDFLNELNACKEQVELFSRVFPDGCELTRGNVMIAFSNDLRVDWLAEKILPQPALAEYQRIKQPAWAEYQRIEQLAWAEYQRIEQPAWAEYERIEQLALAEILEKFAKEQK